MSVDLIRYDLLVQDALRGVVRRVLTDIARDGLPGEHHLFISFNTQAPGVRIATRLKERHPEEMTIVLQHQFWDLIVTEQFFEVGLSFNGIPERLHIPFDALKGFFDPSVKFGLQFEPVPAEDGEEEAPAAARTGPRAVPDRSAPSEEARPVKAKPTSVPSTSSPAAAKAPAKPAAVKPAETKPSEAKRPEPKAPEAKPARAEKPSAPTADKVEDGAAPAGDTNGGAQVVRLDAFRKK